MRSIPVAMTWEMLQRGRWGLILGLLGANLLPAVIYGSFGRLGVELDERSAYVIHSALLQINFFVFGATVCAAQGNPSRVYAFPISTATLVACHLFPTMVFIFLEMVLSSAMLNALLHLNWPLWGPAFFIAVAAAACQVTIWFTEKSAWLLLALPIVVGGLGYWYLSHYSPLLRRSSLWLDITPIEVAILIAVAIASYFVGIVAMSRNRCGETIKPLGIAAWLCRLLDFEPGLAPPFRSPEEAHFWFEWRIKGWAMPFVTVCGIFGAMSIWLMVNREPKNLIEGFVGGGFTLSIVGSIVGLIAGRTSPTRSDFEIGHFLASRPITSTRIARTILNVIGKSVLIAWSIWAISFGLSYGVLVVAGYEPRIFVPDEVRWWYFPWTLLLCWTVVSVVASAVMAGRPKLIAQLVCVCFVLYLALVCISALALSWEARLQLFRGLTCALGVGVIILSAGVFIVARRREVIGSPTVVIGASVWAALSAIVLVEWTRNPTESPAAYLSVIGACALAVVPLALAPLAISWNRVR